MLKLRCGAVKDGKHMNCCQCNQTHSESHRHLNKSGADSVFWVSPHPKHECVWLLWSILEKAFEVSSFKWIASHVKSSADRFKTRGMKIFALVGISPFRLKWPTYFLISLWAVITVWLIHHVCVYVWEIFLFLQWPLQCH